MIPETKDNAPALFFKNHDITVSATNIAHYERLRIFQNNKGNCIMIGDIC